MNSLFRYLLISSLICILPACWHTDPDSTIVQSNDITDIYQHIKPDEYNKNTLVIFDIDNTIAAPAADLGSDQWVDAMINKNMTEGLSGHDAVEALLPTYYQIQMQTWLEPAEKETVPTIQTLQNKNITVIALTTRGMYLAYRTMEQLDRIGIDFSKTSPQKVLVPHGNQRSAVYEKGIIFANGQDKGNVLISWLDQMNYKPQKIIFFDDKMSNLHSLEQVLAKTNFPFVGIRYGYLDDRVKNFDVQAMQKEYELFQQNHPESRLISFLTATS